MAAFKQKNTSSVVQKKFSDNLFGIAKRFFRCGRMSLLIDFDITDDSFVLRCL